MAEFVSSFITGFQELVARDLPERLAGLKILNLFDGLVHYKFDGDSRQLEKIIYFNNTFFVLRTAKGKGLNFASMVGSLCSGKNYFLINKGSFRVRFQNENQFAKVDKNLSRRAEEYISRNSKLTLDRLSPSCEIWFSIRREGFAFCGQHISKREFTEKNLNKGELRPEVAYLMCRFADLKEDQVVLEPFCGYGAIPLQIKKHFKFKKLFVSDIDGEKVKGLTLRLAQGPHAAQGLQIDLRQADVFELSHIEDACIDSIVTDPPWGLWENIPDIEDFYNRMFVSFKRVLKPDGKMTILTARTAEFEKVVQNAGLKITDSLHTLVNGKKASLYVIARSTATRQSL